MPVVRLSDLLGQPRAATFLRGVVASGRIGTAYLFTGPSGVGKGTAALAFARALLCAQPTDDACGECPSCVKTASLQHPDLKFLFPVSGEERELDTTVGETLQAMREDPLFVFNYEKAASIRLSLTRELLRELAFQPFEAARRVVVVRDADRMREDQYSAMLKAIEEPGAQTVWVLTTSRPARLPATIHSRCQQVRFVPLEETMVLEFLEKSAGVSSKDSRLLAAFAGGSLGRALVLRDSEPARTRDEALALLEPALSGNAAGLWKAVQAFSNYGRTGRETMRRMIEFHALWLRDLLRVRSGLGSEHLMNADREPELRRQAEKVDAREVRRRLMVLEEALQSIESNVTPDLTLFSTLARVAGARLNEGRWPAHPTARWDY